MTRGGSSVRTRHRGSIALLRPAGGAPTAGRPQIPDRRPGCLQGLRWKIAAVPSPGRSVAGAESRRGGATIAGSRNRSSWWRKRKGRRLASGRTRDWSGKRDLNPRLRPWQGRTLPLSYSRPSPAARAAVILATAPAAVNPPQHQRVRVRARPATGRGRQAQRVSRAPRRPRRGRAFRHVRCRGTR